jgi:hypothetical protein
MSMFFEAHAKLEVGTGPCKGVLVGLSTIQKVGT